MNLEQLKAALRTAIEALHARQTALETAQRTINEADETADLPALRTSFDAAAAEFDEAGEEVVRCRTNLADAERRQRLIDENPVPDAPANPARAKGGQHELTYRPDGPGGSRAAWRNLVTDLFATQFGMGGESAERVRRNNAEQCDVIAERGLQYRDVGTAAFAGLTVPQFLIDEFAPFLRAGRPLANMVRRLELPASGMVISISRLTTGTAVAVQATENSAVQETDEDDTKLDINVCTYAGAQDVSRQALERSEMVEEITFGDLVSAYATKVDNAIINDPGSGGTHLGIRSTSGIVAVTYTDATPTVGELYPKGADAMQQINGGLFTGATAWLMHSRRWGWFTAALDANGRPLIVPDANGPFNPLAVGDAGEYGQVVGRWHGKPVVLDDNIGTTLGAGTEDVILGVRSPELILWEEGDGAPRRLKFEETQGGSLTVKLVVYGYSAFTAGRYPKASAVISGTGLIAPTF